MTERNIAAEVLDGLREIGEYRTGRRTLGTGQVPPAPLRRSTDPHGSEVSRYL